MNKAVERALVGAVGGLIATIPMTVFMAMTHDRLPTSEQYPLPPREITDVVAARAGSAGQLDEGEATALAYAAHFGFGAAAGTLYGEFAPLLPGPALALGISYGLVVWAGNYLGILPALDILQPATQHPPRRTELMIAAHVIWGAALGLVTAQLSPSAQP